MKGKSKDSVTCDAGKFRHYLDLEKLTTTRGGIGNIHESWSHDAYVWGEIRPINGRLGELAKQRQPEVTHAITARYDAKIQPLKRFVYRGRILNILEVLDIDERNRRLEILAKETVDNES